AKDSALDFWRPATLRAAELLEWLALPLAGAIPCPATLLSAALYQLAGYPARAFGLLATASENRRESDLLRALLKGDFPVLFRVLASYWAAPEYRERARRRVLDQQEGDGFGLD